jgi:hypothetical protein
MGPTVGMFRAKLVTPMGKAAAGRGYLRVGPSVVRVLRVAEERVPEIKSGA